MHGAASWIAPVVIEHSPRMFVRSDCLTCMLHLQRMRSGSTGVAVLLAADWLTVSWLGDSQAMLVKKGEPVILMDPHKPEREVQRTWDHGSLFIIKNIHY